MWYSEQVSKHANKEKRFLKLHTMEFLLSKFVMKLCSGRSETYASSKDVELPKCVFTR